ncbi:MAG: hypothetical protein HYY16_08760 [Planctomycetes bacterium]|nr:hypothetical protein [Planctomycetota bacterium]
MIGRGCCLLLLPAALMGATPQDPQTTDESFPFVRTVSGDLRIWRGGAAASTLLKEERVPPSARLGTSQGEHASFSTEGETLISLKGVRVGRDKGIGIERRDKKLLFKLWDGKIAVDAYEADVIVETPHGLVEGAKVCLLVEADPNGMTVVSIDGELTLSNSLGSVKIKAGEKSAVPKGKPPVEATRADMLRETRRFEMVRNLVRNPGFEDELKYWEAGNDNNKNFAVIDTKLAAWGRRCARLQISSRALGARPEWLPFRQPVKLEKGKRYLARAYLRTETTLGQIQPVLALEPDGAKSMESWFSREVSCENKWKRAQMIFIAQDTLYNIRISSNTSEEVEGVILADEFYLGELDAGAPPK